MPLVDTGLIVRYYIDEAASGTGPTDFLDAGPSPAYNLPIFYNGNAFFTEVSGNRGWESTQTAGDQRGDRLIDDISDKIRDIEGGKKYTLEVVIRVDGFSISASRLLAINESSSSPSLGFRGTAFDDWQLTFNEAIVESWTQTLGTRIVLHAVIDTTQAVGADRIKIYIDGVLKSPDVKSPPAQDATLSIANGSRLFICNRGDGTPRDRSIDGVFFYGAIYSVAMPQADITTNFDILTADDDNPVAVEIPAARPAWNYRLHA